MNYSIVTDIDKIDSIDFAPTIIVGFYQYDNEALFSKFCKAFKDRFPEIDIIGCSSESNICDVIPYVDTDGALVCTFVCMDIKKESYSLQFFPVQEEPKIRIKENKPYGAIIFSAHDSDNLAQVIAMLQLQKNIGQNSFFGVISGAPKLDAGTIYYHGEYVSKGTLVWFIDQEHYLLKGISVYSFYPIGFELEITKADGYTIYEIEGMPALDVVEEMVGILDMKSIASFDHPFFITSVKRNTALDKNNQSEKMPLTALIDINRETKTIILYRRVHKGDKLKISIPYAREEQEKQLKEFRDFSVTNGVGFLFICVGFKSNLGQMEPIYLMRLSKNLRVPFAGLHGFGEIGPLQPQGISMIQNQTLTLAVLSEK